MSAGCKICGSPTNKLLERRILGKYLGEYYQCTHCGFLQIFDHPWLAESYSSAITSLDIGLVQRNLDFAPRVMTVIDYLLKGNTRRYLDYGGGYGLFVRLMRDKGYDFYRYDTYCENLFASSFDYQVGGNSPANFDLLTAFEVFEHIPNPVQELETMLGLSDHIFFSTELQPEGEAALANWWYLLPEIGQHISFYSRKSLELLAQRYGLNFYTDGRFFHLFTRQKISPALFGLLTRKKVSSGLWFLRPGKKSLLQTDYQRLLHSKSIAG